MKTVKKITVLKKITIAIFFHEDTLPHLRKYWIGVRAKDGSCLKVIRIMRSTGAQGLRSAIKYLETL